MSDRIELTNNGFGASNHSGWQTAAQEAYQSNVDWKCVNKARDIGANIGAGIGLTVGLPIGILIAGATAEIPIVGPLIAPIGVLPATLLPMGGAVVGNGVGEAIGRRICKA